MSPKRTPPNTVENIKASSTVTKNKSTKKKKKVKKGADGGKGEGVPVEVKDTAQPNNSRCSTL